MALDERYVNFLALLICQTNILINKAYKERSDNFRVCKITLLKTKEHTDKAFESIQRHYDSQPSMPEREILIKLAEALNLKFSYEPHMSQH
jgi:hypothetical protein